MPFGVLTGAVISIRMMLFRVTFATSSNRVETFSLSCQVRKCCYSLTRRLNNIRKQEGKSRKQKAIYRKASSNSSSPPSFLIFLDINWRNSLNSTVVRKLSLDTSRTNDFSSLSVTGRTNQNTHVNVFNQYHCQRPCHTPITLL